MSKDVIVLLYLLYGFVFIIMGLYAIKEYRKSNSVLPLVNAIVFLGIFGITHGISEWVTMFRYMEVFNDYRIELFFVSRILKAISFLSLIQFGFTLLFKPFFRKIGFGFLIAFFLIFIGIFYKILYTQGMDYLYNNPEFLIISLRYMMALPGAILSMVVLIIHGAKVSKLDRTWMWQYYYLAFSIMVYGILDGLFVRKADFFPANVFYSEWFEQTLKIPVQGLKIMVGIMLFYGVALVIKSFAWEKKYKLISLKTQEEYMRKKQQLNQLLHDDLIQSLFISGLKIEGLKQDCKNEESLQVFTDAIDSINANINTLRNFIKNSQTPTVSVEDFNKNVTAIFNDTLINSNCQIEYLNLLDKQGLYVINKEVLTQIYHVLKELLLNVYKHAQATRVKVIIYQEINNLKLIVEDNGIGFDINTTVSGSNFGISNVKERVIRLNGNIRVQSSLKKRWKPSKTKITILIPIEVNHV